ncbi:NAD-dependent epimerase/dehydratase family protein [Rhodonellum sp.]|uniref:NAD-dependent epimerase/dehydratase family protein n=1 Tax=Rhodonellum sp. TaxID=2231180 RepID=UPI002715CA72|nr:NAD-dependent epimerase/dehydratase family protein [Rhodonellum sp.]MDO9553508.1 NAD-dependent epimerase/dehydratase family protein [Rhodonellum sp.]
MKTVGIIGGSGFIGSHNTKKFLKEGYHVKVSTTDISKVEKYIHLKHLPNAENLELVALNVENKSELEGFLTGCEIVIHGGTPFQLAVKDPKTELFDPTVKGTENFLDATQKTPGIKKVVIIASVAAFNTDFPLPAGNKNPDETFDESDLPFYGEESHPYGQAKFLAQRTVEQFIASHPHLDFEIVTVSPVLVTGKSLSKREDSTSTGIQFLFKNKIAPDPFFQGFYDNDIEFAMVDVEDIAEGIFQAASKTGLHGKNYLLTSETYPVSDITRMLNHEEPGNQPKTVYANTLAINDLGIKFKTVMESLGEY